MLPKIYRLPLHPEQRFRGQSIYLPHLQIVYQTNTKPYSRVAFIVSKKAFRHAVDRNRIKRQLRHLFWIFLKNNSLHYDMMVIIKPGIQAIDLTKLPYHLENSLPSQS